MYEVVRAHGLRQPQPGVFSKCNLQALKPALLRLKLSNRKSMSGIEQGQRDLGNRIDQIQREARADFRWIIGIQFTTLLTLGTLILVKLG